MGQAFERKTQGFCADCGAWEVHFEVVGDFEKYPEGRVIAEQRIHKKLSLEPCPSQES